MIKRSTNGSVGLWFLRPRKAASGPFEVTGLVPGGAAERSQAVKPGDLFNAVDGQDVTTMTDAQVAALCRGAPNTPLTLTLCGKAPPSQEKLYQAARNGNIMEAKALLASGAEADALFRGITISRAK